MYRQSLVLVRARPTKNSHRPDLTIFNKMLDINKIIEEFPHPTITPIIWIPSYETLVEVHIKLNLNVTSVHSELGNGALGPLSLTVTPAVYNTLGGVPFIAPETRD